MPTRPPHVPRTRLRGLPLLLAGFGLVLGACHRDASTVNDAAPVFTDAAAPSASGVLDGDASEASPTRPAVPSSSPRTSGPARPGCQRGWVTPKAATPMFTDPLGIIRRTAPVDGKLVVVDMRMFVGPESPPSQDKGYLMDIRRWYVRLYAEDDWSYQGRFLVEQRRFGRGVSAVAPYDTSGFASPDWSGFQWDAADTTQRAYPGLPGEWAGVRYDFVNGGAGLTIPGLPESVVGCLEGT